MFAFDFKMSSSRSGTRAFFVFLLTLSCLFGVPCDNANEEHQSIKRLYSEDGGESSCICGLSKELLDKLESIVKQTDKIQQCSLDPKTPLQKNDSNVTQQPPSQDSKPSGDQQVTSIGSQIEPPNDQVGLGSSLNGSLPSITGSWSLGGNSGGGSTSLIGQLTAQIEALQAQLAHLRPVSNSNQPPQQQPPPNSQQQQPQQQQSNYGSQNPPFSVSSSLGTNLNPFNQWSGSYGIQGQGGSGGGGISQLGLGSLLSGLSSWGLPPGVLESQANSQQGNEQQTLRPLGMLQQGLGGAPGFAGVSGFLQGLTAISNVSAVLSQGQKVEPQQVQAAVVSTVPNVVSNIFTNIQDLAIQTEHNPNNTAGSSLSAGSQLTSIDGSSAQLNRNDTATQITEQGEQLFLQWIEHQIETYHMTASMAAYIRRSALNLFRRIVQQYVKRIERVGGAVENNVRQATQLALNNTQHLIAFLLRNYLNFAGGLMQIMGEQVSRVGKQLDSTGTTIAHINLNPFDIVSNVIDSLPNPSRYSEYFRAFGKYLMGETPSVQTSSSSSGQSEQTQKASDQGQQGQDQDPRQQSLISKTMGALGKTLGSWLG